MPNFNQVIIIGHLTREPELSYTPSQTAVVKFGIATNRRWTADDGTQRNAVCFADCTAFGKRAETINQYCNKGDALFVQGHLNLDKWTDNQGRSRQKLYIAIDQFQFLSKSDHDQVQAKPETEEEVPF